MLAVGTEGAKIIGRRPISERPANVEKRSQIGHWEGDTLIGKGHKQAIVSLVERKSGNVIFQAPLKSVVLRVCIQDVQI